MLNIPHQVLSSHLFLLILWHLGWFCIELCYTTFHVVHVSQEEHHLVCFACCATLGWIQTLHLPMKEKVPSSSIIFKPWKGIVFFIINICCKVKIVKLSGRNNIWNTLNHILWQIMLNEKGILFSVFPHHPMLFESP